jgi:hydroxypyruvate isomerase
MVWTLRYASHLGYRSPDTPLFRESVGSLDPVAHIEFAAELGFSGVQYALARSRPVEEQEIVGKRLARHGLETGCLVYASFDRLIEPLWSSTGPATRALLATELAAAFETAKRINTRYLAILSGADPRQPIPLQIAALTENLVWAADLAERAGVVLCLEALNRKSLPNMLLHHIGDAYAVVKAVRSPWVRLIFDTGHVQAMDGDVLANLDATWDAIALVQIADNPGRVEMGAGELNFANIFAALQAKKYRGLVELEHQWRRPGRGSEQGGIEYLRRIDQALTGEAE